MFLTALVYFIGLLEKLTLVLTVTSVVSGIVLGFAAFFGLISYADDYTDSAAFCKRIVRFMAWFFVPSVIALTVLPAQKTAYMMVGAYATQKVAEDPRTQEITGKIIKIVNQKLDAFVNEGIEEANKKVKEQAK